MTDLRSRMRVYDQAPTPDYWSEVEMRASAAPAAARPDPGMRRALLFAGTLLVVLTISAAAAVGSGVVEFPDLVVPPAPSAAESVTPVPSSPPFTGERITPDGPLMSGTLYTVNVFEPDFTFSLPAFGMRDLVGQATDWCDMIELDQRAVVLRYKMGCRMALSILRPYAVECGTPTSHPDAATLAEAILSNPAMVSPRDLGTLQDVADLAPYMDFGTHTGRVLRVGGRPMSQDGVWNPADCLLLGESLAIGTTIDVGDVDALYFLVDTTEGLVVIRWGPGWDQSSVAAALAAGYRGDSNWDGAIQAFREFRFLD